VLPPVKPLQKGTADEASGLSLVDADRQSYPMGQRHVPLTSIPTLGQVSGALPLFLVPRFPFPFHGLSSNGKMEKLSN